MALTADDLREGEKNAKWQLHHLRWWVCRVQLQMLVVSIITIVLVCVSYDKVANELHRASWVPCCCNYTFTEVQVYMPTEPTFVEFTRVSVTNDDTKILGPEILAYAQDMVTALQNGSYKEIAEERACPKGDPKAGGASPVDGWSTCFFGRGRKGFKKLRLRYPLQFDKHFPYFPKGSWDFILNVVWKTMVMAVVGCLLAVLPFIFTLALFAFSMPRTTPTEREQRENGDRSCW